MLFYEPLKINGGSGRDKKMKKFLVFLILISLYPSVILAKTYEVETTGEYVMGDRDTKADARRIALEHATLLAVEQLGTSLESETVVMNNQVTKDEIRTYTYAVVKTIMLSEDMKLMENKVTVFSLKIKANVDISILEKKIKEVKADTQRSNQIAALQLENKRLLKELESLSAQLNAGKGEQYKRLRQERENILEELDKNRNSIRFAFEKGTLLTLSLKNRAELEERKKNIDEALQFIADNTKFTLGEPKIINDNDNSHLVIDVEWQIQNIKELLNMLSLFYEDPQVMTVYYSSITLYDHGFKGINNKILKKYFKDKAVRLYIQAGKWKQFKDLIDSSLFIEIPISKKVSLTINNIPTNQLSQITGTEAKVIVESKTNTTLDQPKEVLKKSDQPKKALKKLDKSKKTSKKSRKRKKYHR
jgi:hypothetical protein